ncbi:MAG: hypothetical protein AAF600_15970 [Bacteroidota bacterium]
MLIEEKYFLQDKNHLLKTVQAFSKDILLDVWLQEILTAYGLQHNPMGLEDDFIFELNKKIFAAKNLLEDPYNTLAAIYRFDYGDNQLTFQWDGRTHMEVYDSDWKTMYTHWVKQLSLIKEIQRPVLRYAVSDQQTNTGFLRQSIKRGILSFFNIRLRAKTLHRLSA